MRLAIVSALAVNESLTFNELKALLDTTDGNLSVHARKLEEAQYITCTKSFEGRLPKTVYRLSPAGRAALERYLDHMEALIRATRSAEPWAGFTSASSWMGMAGGRPARGPRAPRVIGAARPWFVRSWKRRPRSRSAP
jgi:DNA-binding transcriptional ArsR family regulator